MAAKPLPAATLKIVYDGLAAGDSHRTICRRAKCSQATVANYAKKKPPVERVRVHPHSVSLPDPLPIRYEPFRVDDVGPALVLSDVHLPYHDKAAVEAAVAAGRKRGCGTVVLNGDILDSHEISNHGREGNKARYVEEIEYGRQFFAWVRKQFPKARIVYKTGNHEDRLDRYILDRAPALFGLEGVNLQSLLHLQDHGVEWVTGKRVIRLGRLHLVHGHEYRGGGGVNPARWLYLRAGSVAMTSHFHRTSEHHDKTIDQQYRAAWSIGCLCNQNPEYMPLNQWNHGASIVTISSDGTFSVDNKRIMDGKVV